jgi:hypothetical protein
MGPARRTLRKCSDSAADGGREEELNTSRRAGRRRTPRLDLSLTNERNGYMLKRRFTRAPHEGDSASRGRRSRRVQLGAIGLTLAAFLVGINLASAVNIGGFEIDANESPVERALYAGNNTPPGDDWAEKTNPPPASGEGVFEPSAGLPHTAATDCYDSDIDKNLEPSTLICDGNSDSRFRTIEPEQNIVSPSGKTPDDVWPVKPGNVRPKNDFSHAYVHASTVDSPCDEDSDADDVVLHLAGHVGDNEGSHFWGFEFNETAPTNFDLLKQADGDIFNLDFNRVVGDMLVSFTVPGSANEPVALELFTVTGFQPDGDAIFTLAGALEGCPDDQPQGLSLLATNNANDVEAPPWNIPVCDPTADNGSNTCRLANGLTDAEDLIAPRDFAEASIDLTAFGIDPCFTNVIFTSRSSHVLEGADIQDVGGGDFPLCGTKSGVKFHDLNGNGTQDAGPPAEPGLNGWVINLYSDDNGDGILQASEAVADQTTTTSTIDGVVGSYKFESLSNGDYIVCEVLQASWHQSLPNAGSDELADCTSESGDTTLGPNGYAFTMAGANQPGNDFGNFQNGTKSGTKFVDLDGDGAAREAGEPGLGGVEIHLVGTDGLGNAVHLHTTTAADGTYSFSAPPGSYTACETVPTGYTQSYPNASTPNTTDCVAPHSGRGWVVVLTSGSTDSGNDFGNFQNATVSGMKFKDANANGLKEDGEAGLGTWVIHLFGTDGQGNAVHRHETTAADGTYSFTGLAPGSYTVCEQVSGKPGWVQSFPTSGADCTGHTHDGIVPGPIGYAVTVTSGQTVANRDFGNKPASEVTVTFTPLADLPGGADATRATAISCEDANGGSVGSNTNSNTLTTSNVFTNQSAVTCTITFIDP